MLYIKTWWLLSCSCISGALLLIAYFGEDQLPSCGNTQDSGGEAMWGRTGASC